MYIRADINECLLDGVCHEMAVCNNTAGSFECECRVGYDGNGQNCTGEGDTRLLSVKTFFYACNGYYKFICAHHYISGVDIDECGVGNNQCHEDAHCTNTEGSYVCACLPGFQGDGYNCTG